jgi:peptidoglycan/LPS O-acetylase OafA/YrhL
MMCGAFFVEGYILTTLPKKKFSFLQCISLVGVGVLLTILLSIYHVQEVDRFAYSMFSPGLVFIATGLFMTIRLVDPFFEKYSERTKHSIRAISVASFGVYLIHEAVHMSFRYLLLTSHMTYLLRSDLFIEYIRTIIIYSLSTAIILLIQRIPYVKRIVP